MRSGSILIALAASISIAGCASCPCDVPAAQAAPAATAAQLTAANDAASDPDRKICKVTQVTGTRIQKQKLCYTAREWEELADASQKAMRDVERSNSTGAGGESLPTSDLPGGR